MTKQTLNTTDHRFLESIKETLLNPQSIMNALILKNDRRRKIYVLAVFARDFLFSRFGTKQRDRGIRYSRNMMYDMITIN